MNNIAIPIVVMSSAIFLLSYMTVSNAYSLPPGSVEKNININALKSLSASSKINKATTKCYVIKNGKFVEVPCPDVIIVTKAAAKQ